MSAKRKPAAPTAAEALDRDLRAYDNAIRRQLSRLARRICRSALLLPAEGTKDDYRRLPLSTSLPCRFGDTRIVAVAAYYKWWPAGASVVDGHKLCQVLLKNGEQSALDDLDLSLRWRILRSVALRLILQLSEMENKQP